MPPQGGQLHVSAMVPFLTPLFGENNATLYQPIPRPASRIRASQTWDVCAHGRLGGGAALPRYKEQQAPNWGDGSASENSNHCHCWPNDNARLCLSGSVPAHTKHGYGVSPCAEILQVCILNWTYCSSQDLTVHTHTPAGVLPRHHRAAPFAPLFAHLHIGVLNKRIKCRLLEPCSDIAGWGRGEWMYESRHHRSGKLHLQPKCLGQ